MEKDSGFQIHTFESRDEFKRKLIAEKVIELLKSDVQISPMMIDGPWGSGKTEFIHKLKNLFYTEQGDYILFYIDAFRADHADDALMTLVAAILKEFPADEATMKEKIIPALKFAAKTSLKAGVSWILRQEFSNVVEGAEKEIKDASDSIINTSIESLLKDHQKAEENISFLQEYLKDISKENPMIIFIDELDRCRPNFAVEILEKVKHVFDLENIQFVLISNKEQLKASIKHHYGSQINAQKYIDKFFNYCFSLPSTRTVNHEKMDFYPLMHYSNLISNSAVLKDMQLSTNSSLEIIRKLFEVNDINLREVETFVRTIEIFQTLSSDLKTGDHLMLQLIGIFIFCFNPRIQKEIEFQNYDAKELNKLIGINKYIHDKSESSLNRVLTMSGLFYLEANTNGWDDGWSLGQAEKQHLNDKVWTYFDDYMDYGKNGRIRILEKTISVLNMAKFNE